LSALRAPEQRDKRYLRELLLLAAQLTECGGLHVAGAAVG